MTCLFACLFTCPILSQPPQLHLSIRVVRLYACLYACMSARQISRLPPPMCMTMRFDIRIDMCRHCGWACVPDDLAPCTQVPSTTAADGHAVARLEGRAAALGSCKDRTFVNVTCSQDEPMQVRSNFSFNVRSNVRSNLSFNIRANVRSNVGGDGSTWCLPRRPMDCSAPSTGARTCSTAGCT